MKRSAFKTHHTLRACIIGIISLFGLTACDAAELSPPEIPKNSAQIPPKETAQPGFTVQVRQFSTVYEPSGVRALPNGDVLVIEDEIKRSISVLKFHDDGEVTQTPVTKPRQFSVGRIEDLEGVASDDQGYIYVITSHSKTLRGRLPTFRKKLIRYRLDNHTMTGPVVIHDLKKRILKEYGKIKGGVSGKKSDLNIEALSYHRENHTLMIGLREPLVKDKAVVIVMNNPDQAFSQDGKVELADKLITFDLDKGGIRAMAYDPVLDGYLILSRREDKKDKSFKLWIWSGEAKEKPRRIRVNADVDLRYAEGVTPIRTKSMAGILLVFDDGNARRNIGGHYILLPYEDMRMAGENPQ